MKFIFYMRFNDARTNELFWRWSRSGDERNISLDQLPPGTIQEAPTQTAWCWRTITDTTKRRMRSHLPMLYHPSFSTASRLLISFSETICVHLVRRLEILGYVWQKEFQECLSVLLFFIISIFLSFLPFKIVSWVGKSRVQVIWLSVPFLRLSFH